MTTNDVRLFAEVTARQAEEAFRRQMEESYRRIEMHMATARQRPSLERRQLSSHSVIKEGNL